MPKDRDQLTPDDPEDAAHLATNRGQGSAGTGRDVLPGDRGAIGPEDGQELVDSYAGEETPAEAAERADPDVTGADQGA